MRPGASVSALESNKWIAMCHRWITSFAVLLPFFSLLICCLIKRTTNSEKKNGGSAALLILSHFRLAQNEEQPGSNWIFCLRQILFLRLLIQGFDQSMTTKGDCLCSTSLEDKLQIFLLFVSYLDECSSVIRRAINPRTEEEWEKSTDSYFSGEDKSVCCDRRIFPPMW